MLNDGPEPCYHCGETVEAGKGHISFCDGAWRTQHSKCAVERIRNTLKAEREATNENA